ncbi:cadherin-like domain-containing protein [Cocleimonas sp. KMM 6892]|uniref:cadherin-like domain-containing protein n=1 Tax=unclassified Cocleimonas TaxID=2639732 RepID=UPI002DBD4D76|nr:MULTISPECIES: cadherin-like domain-containing protein [unclassified Cocleimonas]MEB8432968.1 cadherin-like domain-containing protein [Cocleimonas sp. KMM 6892]MEC4716051.1 cadherin-like domain-containing protein [Cocleimonas sp. KMM 6895]MEC4745512.1 cadherin-like domain-containing protein [Cocleimonas sp. KMM 6896]
MKKKHISLALLLIPVVAYAAATLRTSSGFYYPSDKTHAESSYIGFGDANVNFGNRCHLANDYNLAEGSPVYAVGLGVVESTSTSIPFYGGDDGTPGGVVVVKYTKSDDTFFYALYGHIKNFTVNAGDTVTGGQKIAEVGAYTSGGSALPHLHFGISNSSPSLEGYTPSTACTDYLGYVDPEPYLIANSPKLSPAETCVAVDDADDTLVNTILTTASVLANDTDTDGDTLTVSTADTTSANGQTITNNGDGTFTYTPAIDFVGTDSFNYTVTDSNGCNDEAVFTISVKADSDTTDSESSSSGGGSLNTMGLISLLGLLLIRRFRKLSLK